MHSIDDPLSTMPHYLSSFKECIGCMRSLPVSVFQKDSSYRDGRKDLCSMCESSPRLSTAEHTARLKEANFNSEAVKVQRWAYQDDYRDDAARVGQTMHSSDLVRRIQELIPCLFITEGRIVGDLAVFKTYPGPQERLNGRSYEYLFYCPTGTLNEYSTYEFEKERDIPLREKKRGWRTVLLRLIKCGLLTEDKCNEVFGRPHGPASAVWSRELWQFRNRQKFTN